MNKYVNEMEDYLYNHNYISRNKNKDPFRQQELSQERASCIVQKYRTLTEEKDKEIERLNNTIDECADRIMKELNENNHLSIGVALSIRHKLLNYKELKEGK